MTYRSKNIKIHPISRQLFFVGCFIFSQWIFIVNQKFWNTRVQNSKFICFIWNLIPGITRTYRVWWWCPFLIIWTENIFFWGNFGPKFQIFGFKLKFGILTSLNKLNLLVILTFLDRKYPFWIQNCVFKVKFGTQTNWNMKILMMMFIFIQGW